MPIKNAIYAQSGGVTAVINASACGLIQTARQHADLIGTVFAARNGIIGVLSEQLIDTSKESNSDIAKLLHTPAGAFGSCRYKLKDSVEEFNRLISVFKAHDIGYFFYNGGGDSQDTANKIAMFSQQIGYPITCIGIPKTIDNDLPLTDTCPGFGSVAKYVAIATLEAGFDVASMAASSTKVFILEVMGRHAGWIAAASGLANSDIAKPPHLILFPEIPFVPEVFLAKTQACVEKYGYCVVVASEGIRTEHEKFVSETGSCDDFGHSQLGGVAPVIAQLIKTKLNYKCHFAIADYLQRSARHIAAKVDVEQAYALGRAAIEFAINGHNAIMPIIKRLQSSPYQWTIDYVPLTAVANQEKMMPKDFIREDGMGITAQCRQYLEPLIQGEAYPPFIDGLPDYIRLKNISVKPKLAAFQIKAG